MRSRGGPTSRASREHRRRKFQSIHAARDRRAAAYPGRVDAPSPLPSPSITRASPRRPERRWLYPLDDAAVKPRQSRSKPPRAATAPASPSRLRPRGQLKTEPMEAYACSGDESNGKQCARQPIMLGRRRWSGRSPLPDRALLDHRAQPWRRPARSFSLIRSAPSAALERTG